MGTGPNDAGQFAAPPDRRLRGQPEAARHRLHRPLPGAPMGRRDAARGDARGARRPRPRRQGPLRRLLELLRLAHDEGARRSPTRTGCQRFVSQQIHYTLQAREAEYELVPLGLDQGLGILVWSPLAGGLLSGKFRRDEQARRGLAPPHRLARAADPRRGGALRHRRRARRGRRGARRLGGAGGARLAARPARRHLGDHRRPHRGAVRATTSPPPTWS